MVGHKLPCSMGLVGVCNVQVIGRITYPGLQGCVLHTERSALRRGRQILSTQVPKAPALGIGWQIGRPRPVETVLFGLLGYGIVPMLPRDCGAVVQDVTLCNEQ
jgi:hypothetical protein